MNSDDDQAVKKKIVLIGPILPYRGGIAQHTTMMHRQLGQLARLKTLSFTRQYPSWLFPGESDKDPEYKDYLEPNVEYLIDSLNPLSWQAAARRAQDFNPDIAVIPWWTIYWFPCFLYVSWVLRKNGIRVIFFCHNVIDHESANWKIKLTKFLFSQASGFIVHTKEDRNYIKKYLPTAQIYTHPHPIYHQFPEAKGQLIRRKKIELLFYGFIRPYKGLDLLIEAMGQLKGESVQLTVAGEFWQGEKQIHAQIQTLGIENQVELCNHYHSEQETAELFARADFVVLPYKSATGSGVVPLAYHYNKPVIVTRVGGLPDVVNERKTGLIITPGSVSELVAAIRFIPELNRDNLYREIIEIKKKFTWRSLALMIIKFA